MTPEEGPEPRERDGGSRAATLRRGIRLLEVLSTVDGSRICCTRVTDLTRMLDTHKSQISRNLAVLADLGIVEQCAEHRGYRLTWELYRLGVRSHHRLIVTTAMEALEWLARHLKLSSYLVIRSGLGVYPLWSVAPSDDVPLSPPGLGWSLHASAAGTALLMDYDRETFFAEFGDVSFERFTERTPTTATEVWEKITMAKRLGYAIQIGDFDPELCAIAVPVVNPFERFVFAVSGSPAAMTDRVVEISDALLFAAGRMRKKFTLLHGRQSADQDVPRWLSHLSMAERRRGKNE